MELQTPNGGSIVFSGKELHTPRVICGSAIYTLELRKVQVDFTPVLRAVREGKQAGCHL